MRTDAQLEREVLNAPNKSFSELVRWALELSEEERKRVEIVMEKMKRLGWTDESLRGLSPIVG